LRPIRKAHTGRGFAECCRRIRDQSGWMLDIAHVDRRTR
jgi:hypothetical protein